MILIKAGVEMADYSFYNNKVSVEMTDYSFLQH